ncbi:MAG: hypothetical protein NVS3B14_01910 [Ktedonobacteraceae bacterium]
MQWLMGPVKSVFAYADSLAHRMETEDVAVATHQLSSSVPRAKQTTPLLNEFWQWLVVRRASGHEE